MTKVEEFYNTLIKDPDLEVKAGQTREQAAKQEAEYRARQYNNNVQALSLANEPAQVESPINALFNHLEQMKKSMPDTALIKAREDFETPAAEEGTGPNKAERRINDRARGYHTDIKNEERARNLRGQNYKKVLQEHEANKIADADRANRRFQVRHEGAERTYNERQQRFKNAYTIRQARAEDLKRPVQQAESRKAARKQRIENFRNLLNESDKRTSNELKQGRKSANDNQIRRSEEYKEEFRRLEQRNLARAKSLQDSFAGETKADRIDAYRKTLQEGNSEFGRQQEMSFDEAQKRMYPQEGEAYPTQDEQYSIIRGRNPNGQNLSNAEVKNLLNPKPLTDKEYHQQLVDSRRYPNINSIEDAKAAIDPKPRTDEQIIQSLIDNTDEFEFIETAEDAKATMNPKPFTKKEKYDIVREQMKKDKEGGLFSRFRNKKVTDADVTAALNPKQLTREEKIERLMDGMGGTDKLSREEALEALKKPKQLTNKEKLQNLIDSDLPQYSNIKTEADAKNYLNPKPLTEQQQHEYIADRFSLSGPDDAAKAINNTPFTDEEKIQFVKDRVRGPAERAEISTEEADNLLNPKNKHFERPTFVDDPPTETESTAEEPAAEEPAPEAEAPEAEAPAEEAPAEVDAPTEESTPEETPTQEAPAAEEPTGIGAINRDAAEILQEQNDKLANNNKEIESNQNKISEIDSKVEELESKQNSEEGLSEQEFQDLQSLPDEKRSLERQIETFDNENESVKGMQDAVLQGMKQNHQLTDDDIKKLRESNDINALIDEGTQPETTQEETTPEPEQPEVTPEQSTDTPPATSKINPRTAAAAKEHLGEERYNELLENGDLEGKNIADIREEFPKPDAEEPETATAEEEPKTETEEPAAEPEQPEAEAPQAETPAETPEPEPQATTPEMDNLIDTAKQNQKDENGEEIEGSSLFDHLYEKTHGKDNPYGDKEDFERELRAQDPSKLKTKLRDEHLKRQQADEKNEAAAKRDAEQKEIKDQADRKKQAKEEANTLPHDESHFNDVSKDEATHMAVEMIAHHDKHKDNISPASKKKLDKTLAAAKDAGADLERIAHDKQHLGDKFGDENHLGKIETEMADNEHVTSDSLESKKARRRAGMEASEAAKVFHHGEDLNNKTETSHNEKGHVEHFDHKSHKKSAGQPDLKSMPPALREIVEEQAKENPDKQLISKNKEFLAQKEKDGYTYQPGLGGGRGSWVHKEGLSKLGGSHKGNSGTLLDGAHAMGKHPATLLNNDGGAFSGKAMYSKGKLFDVGGSSLTGKALQHSMEQAGIDVGQDHGTGGTKIHSTGEHEKYAGLATESSLLPKTGREMQAIGSAKGKEIGTRLAREGFPVRQAGSAAKTALGRLKTSFLDGFMNKSEYPYNYPSAVKLLSKNYSHESRLEAKKLLEQTSKKKKVQKILV